ncbi:MAG: hypothetical protein V4614_08020 [Pseudomonadota bacterium]
MHDPEHLKARLAEAARYALLRRVAPAMRHDMAGALQPISMMAAMLEKRLQKPEPDMAALARNGGAINTLAREASAACMSLMTWLAPKEDSRVPFKACVTESLALVATELSFRGFNIVNDIPEIEAEVLLSSVRGSFMASLLALTDACSEPSNVTLTAKTTGNQITLVMALSASGAEAFATGATLPYRKLGWDDVQAIADAQQVGLEFGDGTATLSYQF